MPILRLDPEQKLVAVEEVIVSKQDVSSVGRSYGVSRQAIYKWCNLYNQYIKECQDQGKIFSRQELLEALREKYVSRENHWNWAGDEARDSVVEAALSNPSASISQLLTQLPKKEDGSAIIGYFGVQKILEGKELNTSEKRLNRVQKLREMREKERV